MKAILLLGGFGTRLRPLTNDIPKQMLPVCGRPMIEWVCEHLARHGVSEAVLSLGYRAEAFTSAYPQGRIGPLEFGVAVEPEPRGTAGAVRFAAEAAGIDGPFLALNADVLTDLDVSALVSFHRSVGAEATIALQPVADPTPYGLVVVDDSGRVLSFSEKPGPDAALPQRPRGEWPTVSAGTYVLTPAVLDRIAPDRAVSIEREVFSRIAGEGMLAALVSDSYWHDTGTPQQYLAANLDILEGRRANACVAEGSADPSAVIHPDAHIAMSVIGPGCEVGPDAVVQRSVLAAGCRVRKGAMVVDSMLGPGAVVGAAAMLTECSVIGSGEQVLGGARLRGVRQPTA